MTVTQVDPFEKALEQLETKFNLEWTFKEKRSEFLNDTKKIIENINGRFRYRVNGSSIPNIEETMTQALQNQGTKIYVKIRPGIKEKYSPVFPSRDQGTKRAHENFTRSFVEKALLHNGIVFTKGFKEMAVDLISKNFLASDDEEKGLVFQRIQDTEIGSIASSQKFDINSLINNLNIAGWVDDLATRISKAQHRGELRKIAASMVAVGSKPDQVEKQIDELISFESRSLTTGKKIPHFGKDQLESELMKFHSLNTDDKAQATVRARQSLAKIDDLMDLKLEARKVVVKPELTNHDGF